LALLALLALAGIVIAIVGAALLMYSAVGFYRTKSVA